jgi:hypothetical protein
MFDRWQGEIDETSWLETWISKTRDTEQFSTEWIGRLKIEPVLAFA